MESSTAICFLRSRVKFLDENGKPKNTPLQGQMVLFFGEDLNSFSENFKSIGNIFVNPLTTK